MVDISYINIVFASYDTIINLILYIYLIANKERNSVYQLKNYHWIYTSKIFKKILTNIS